MNNLVHFFQTSPVSVTWWLPLFSTIVPAAECFLSWAIMGHYLRERLQVSSIHRPWIDSFHEGKAATLKTGTYCRLHRSILEKLHLLHKPDAIKTPSRTQRQGYHLITTPRFQLETAWWEALVCRCCGHHPSLPYPRGSAPAPPLTSSAACGSLWQHRMLSVCGWQNSRCSHIITS